MTKTFPKTKKHSLTKRPKQKNKKAKAKAKQLKKICHFYAKGICRYGKACRNSHEIETVPITLQEHEDLMYLGNVKLQMQKEGAAGLENFEIDEQKMIDLQKRIQDSTNER